MLCSLRASALPVQAAVRCQRRARAIARSIWSTPEHSPTQGPDHEACRIRIYDLTNRRSYAIDFGHFAGRWFLGPSTSITISRSDDSAGRPNSFKHFPKQLASSSRTAHQSLSVDIASEDESVFIKYSETYFDVTAHIYGASLSLNNANILTGSQQVSQITQLPYKDVSNLSIQTIKLPVLYSFDHPAGYHECGQAFAHVQRMSGNTLAPQWLTCLGYSFGANNSVETMLDITVAGEAFAIGFHSPKLHWYFTSSEDQSQMLSEVEAEYGKVKFTAQQGLSKLVITASAPHRTFDILSLPTAQGFQDKGIQTFNGTATVDAFENDKLVDSQTVTGVNLQFGSAYAERTVQRMTAQQYSSPLRVKGKGVTR